MVLASTILAVTTKVRSIQAYQFQPSRIKRARFISHTHFRRNALSGERLVGFSE